MNISEIVIWMSEEYQGIMQQVLGEYSPVNVVIEQKTKEEIDIALENIIVGNGNLPHLILTDDDTVMKYTYLRRDMFLRLFDYGNMPVFQNFKLGEIAQNDGEIYGVPFTSGAVAYFYRKDIVENVGVSLYDNMSWEEFIESGRYVRESCGAFLLPYPTSTDVQILMRATGYCFYDYNGNVSPDGCSEVLSLFERLYQAGIVCDFPCDKETLYNLLCDGQLAGLMANSSILPIIRDMLQDYGEWGVITLPKSDGFGYDVAVDGLSWLAVKNQQDDEINSSVMEWLNTVVFGNMLPIIEDKKLVPVDDVNISFCPGLNIDEGFDISVINFLVQIGAKVPIIIRGGSSSSLSNLLLEKMSDIAQGNSNSETAYEEFVGQMD